MRRDIREKIYEDANMIRFLRENSMWYKHLSRRLGLDVMRNAMRERYELRLSDKVSKISTGAQFIKAFMDVTKD